MKIGFFSVGIGPTAEPQLLRSVATAAERLGFATIWAPEHVVLVEQYASKYPYSSGEFPGPASIPIADPFTTLAYVAACTSTIRLGTGICLVPEHNPLVLAKTVATVDRLSGGRLILGVGVGWLAEEFAALGIPFERRGARTREYIEVMRKLWTEPVVDFKGKWIQFETARLDPKPIQKPHVPIIVGGYAEAAFRRAVRFGAGWYGFNCDPARTKQMLGELDKAFAKAGRKRGKDFEIIITPPLSLAPDAMKGYADLGVDRLVVNLGSQRPEKVDHRLLEIEQVVKLAA
jgi:probable F420-dependent oxidoreductase